MNVLGIPDVLDAAADEILVRGHCKNVLISGDGKVCLGGAIYTALDPELKSQFNAAMSRHSYQVNAILAKVDAYFERTHSNIPTGNGQGHVSVRYNNRPDTTAGDVIELLRGTAKELRNA